MQIVCPHCATSYAVNTTTFGSAGRTVRCARCKNTWLAHPKEATTTYALAPDAGADDAPATAAESWNETPDDDEMHQALMPIVESPSISSDLPESLEHHDRSPEDTQEEAQAQQNELRTEQSDEDEWPPRSRLDRFGSSLLLGPLAASRSPTKRIASTTSINFTIACAAMSAMVLSLMIWRAEIVRLVPQTAAFFEMAGLGVNLRGLAFEDVKISTELIDNKPVLIIEGNIVDVTKKPTAIPRLRFAVRDASGAEIYAWSAVLEHPKLKPGEKVRFKSRLASPPSEGREIAVRFFNKQDITAGGT